MPKMNHRPSKETAASDSCTSAVPQYVLDLVHGALLPYPVQWDKVLTAILSPDGCEDRFLSTEELCKFLHTSRVSIFRHIKAGKLRAYKIGRRNLFSLREVVATLKNAEVSNV